MGVSEFGGIDGGPDSNFRIEKFGPGDPWNQFGAELDRRKYLQNKEDEDDEDEDPPLEVLDRKLGGVASS